jgi:hypothetical protein
LQGKPFDKLRTGRSDLGVRHIKVVLDIPERVVKPAVFFVLLWRRVRYGYAFRRIPLTQGKFAIVDPEDYNILSQYKWQAQRSARNIYARRVVREDSKRTLILMHREILKMADDLVVDHINHNGLDNRRSNLRPATKKQNGWNKRSKLHSSRFKGVGWNKRTKKWRATICYKGKKISLGLYGDENEAAKAYDEAAKKYRGEFAALNFSE